MLTRGYGGPLRYVQGPGVLADLGTYAAGLGKKVPLLSDAFVDKTYGEALRASLLKAGVHMLTKALATEWAEHNIRVNAIAPGYIRTELTDEVIKEHPDVVRDHWEKGAVQNRIGRVEELVGAAVYLASDAASFTTGEIITIDGGLTLR